MRRQERPWSVPCSLVRGGPVTRARYARRVQSPSRDRVIAVVALGLVGVGGVHLSTEATADTSRQVTELLEREIPAAEAQANALQRDLKFKETDDYFAAQLLADARAFGVAEPELDALRQPQVYRRVVDERRVLAPGKGFRAGRLGVRALVDRVNYVREGASIRARHVIARVKNHGDRPVAYFMRVRSTTRGDCPVRGLRRHNAMALRPGESADIVVCAGTDPIEVLDLRELVVSELGYVYVSRVPPLAVDHELTSVRAHDAGPGLSTCSQVPAEHLRGEIRDGHLQWQDVVDFYSRHNCDRDHFVAGYRLAHEALPKLPVRD